MSEAMASMQHLFWRFWWASPKHFMFPGLYYCHRRNGRIIPLPRLDEATLGPQLVEFPEQNVIVAKDQPEYRPLPCHRFHNDPQGRIAFCWQLSWRDRLRVLRTGKLWHEVLTFYQPLQPQLLRTEKPKMHVPSAAEVCALGASE